MSSAFEHVKKGALHRQLGVPEDQPIPGGKAKMKELCHASVGDMFYIENHGVKVTEKMKKRGCFAANFGYRK